MASYDHRLPADIERGALGSWSGWQTIIGPTDGGREDRQQDWPDPIGGWNIAYSLLSMEQDDPALETYIQAIQSLHAVSRGRLHGFRFKDWSDYKIGNPSNPTASYQVLGFGTDAGQTVFNAIKTYSYGVAPNYNRRIKKLVSGTASVLLDGVVTGAGVTVDYNQGTVTFVTPPAGPTPGPAEEVGLASEFDNAVRFEDDQLNVAVLLASLGEIPSLRLRTDLEI